MLYKFSLSSSNWVKLLPCVSIRFTHAVSASFSFVQGQFSISPAQLVRGFVALSDVLDKPCHRRICLPFSSPVRSFTFIAEVTAGSSQVERDSDD